MKRNIDTDCEKCKIGCHPEHQAGAHLLECNCSPLEQEKWAELEKIACWNKLTQSEKEDLQFFLKSHEQSLRQFISQEIEKEKKERPMRSLADLADGLRKEADMSEKEKMHIRNKDNGFFIENVECIVHNSALSVASKIARGI